MADPKEQVKEKIDQGAEKAKEWTDKGAQAEAQPMR